MRRAALYCLLISGSLAVTIAATARNLGGDVSFGRRTAITQCGICHQLNSTQPRRLRSVWSFEDIANTPSTTAISLRAFLRSNHRRMPNFILSRRETDDVIAYVLSLKRR